MPKHHPHPHPKGEGLKLVGSPEALINLLVNNKTDREYVMNQLVNEGPKHKQVLSALLLTRAYKLVKVIEKNSGTSFISPEGYEFSIEKNEDIFTLPLTMPVNAGAGFDPQEIADAAAQAPEHELLAYSMCLQVIEWAIQSVAVNNSNNN